jgi:hypothetical protein
VSFCPESRVDAEFMRLLDQAADVVADDLAENFVDHRNVCLAPHVIAKLGLDH